MAKKASFNVGSADQRTLSSAPRLCRRRVARRQAPAAHPTEGIDRGGAAARGRAPAGAGGHDGRQVLKALAVGLKVAIACALRAPAQVSVPAAFSADMAGQKIRAAEAWNNVQAAGRFCENGRSHCGCIQPRLDAPSSCPGRGCLVAAAASRLLDGRSAARARIPALPHALRAIRVEAVCRHRGTYGGLARRVRLAYPRMQVQPFDGPWASG